MSTYQSAIDTTSQNISNAGNADYTRQRVTFSSEVGESGRGVGVKIEDVTRIKNDLLDSQIRKYNSSLADANRRSEIMQQIESIIAEPSDNGLSTYFNDFFNSWDKLTTNPNSSQLRYQVIESAQRLSTRFKDVFTGLDNIQSVLQKESSAKADTINGYLKQISVMNQKIYESEVRGIKASELKDQRDKAVDDLSKLVNINAQPTQNGVITVSIGGVQAADQNSYTEFEVNFDSNGKMKLISKSDKSVSAVVNSGELYAIFDLYSKKIPSYQAGFEKIINTFIDKVNDLHRSGNTLIQGASSSTDIPFFGTLDVLGNVQDAFTNGTININQAILDNPGNIAASDTANNDGNGGIANKIARLADSTLSELDNQKLLDAYNSQLNTMGMEKVLSDNAIQSDELIVNQLNTQKTSYSGVSIDEEMTNIMKYQKTYEAAAKMVKVADEMLQTILGMI